MFSKLLPKLQNTATTSDIDNLQEGALLSDISSPHPGPLCKPAVGIEPSHGNGS